MRGSALPFETDLHISLRPVVVALLGVALAVLFLANSPREPLDRVLVLLMAGLLATLAVFAWRLSQWKAWLGRWFVVIVIGLLLHSLSLWWGAPASLILAPLPVALSAALLRTRACITVGVLQTIAIAAFYTGSLPGLALLPPQPWSTLAAAFAGVWTTVAIMFAVYQPVERLARSMWEYYQRTRQMEEDTLARRVELQQALDDLAQANLQLTRLNDLAQGLRQMAEDARTAKEQFVANVSHELRTPLNMITGFAEMILQSPHSYGGNIPPALLADLEVIHRNAEHLADLINDVLDLSQIEADQMPLMKEHVAFRDIVDTAVLAVRPLYESKGLYLHTDLPADLPQVFCDPTRVREVLLNLLSNAGRFTERGGVRLHIHHADGEILITVTDTGRGIEPKDMGKLFQPFQQLDSSIRRQYGGTGLGLSISKGFVELHGGTITVESQPGAGTTFSVKLPVAPRAPLTGDSTRWLNADWTYLQRTHPWRGPKSLTRPRFVVCETGSSLRRLVQRYVDGAEVVAVRDTAEGLDSLGRTPAQALLVNAASVGHDLEALRAEQLPDGVPAILCTLPDVHDPAVSSSERLIKPISQDALLDVLQRVGVQSGTVLVVDDEPDALHLFGRMLAASGHDYRVLQARDGQEALNVLREYRPDVILVDLVMPGMDGYALLAALSADPSLSDIPTVIISARDLADQPMSSRALAVTLRDGLSARQLLNCVEALTQTLSASASVAQAAETTGPELIAPTAGQSLPTTQDASPAFG